MTSLASWRQRYTTWQHTWSDEYRFIISANAGIPCTNDSFVCSLNPPYGFRRPTPHLPCYLGIACTHAMIAITKDAPTNVYPAYSTVFFRSHI